MVTEIFHSSFEKFYQQVEECPLVLVYDRHLSHVLVNVIEKAISGNITVRYCVIKFPRHSFDKLQLLDVRGCEPLKRLWSRELNDWENEFCSKETLIKSAFVDALCSIWHKGLTKDDLISGFRTSGIYPVDLSKYPTSHFNPRLLKKYKYWREKGKLEGILEELQNSSQRARKRKTPPSLAQSTNYLKRKKVLLHYTVWTSLMVKIER